MQNDRQTADNTKTTDKASTWMGTLNNPSVPPEEFLQSLWDTGKFNYVCGQLEQGQSGTPHVQFYVNAGSSQIRFSALKKLAPTCHWEPVRFNKAAQQYVMKEDTRVAGPWEFGQAPKINQSADSVAKAREARAKLNEEIHELGPLESMRQGLISYKDYRAVKQARDMINLDQQAPANMTQERGIWIQGQPRVGKSWIARNAWGAFYLKAQNKWWDGYAGQDTVIIEDMDEQGDKLGHLLKLWADSYSLQGEVKGGTIPLNYKRLIVTSNYSIDHIFGADPDAQMTSKQRTSKEQMAKAIAARFAQVFVYDRSDQQSILNDPEHFKPGQVYHMNALKLLKPAKLSEQRESISPEHLILHQVGVQGSPGFEVTKLILIPQPDDRLNPTNQPAQALLGKRPVSTSQIEMLEPKLKHVKSEAVAQAFSGAAESVAQVFSGAVTVNPTVHDDSVDVDMLEVSDDSVEVSEGDLE